MYFKRLEINGFKSFADPVVITFQEGITCIVGQNGSGKSNISDAIRWVLGEQSPKALRCDRMDEVIFGGTGKRKEKGMAEVTLTIDNSAGILRTPYSEVAITRRMYRTGESEYLLNSDPCRLRDIRNLIMDTGIGVEGFSIIGQGRIADIVGNKSDSRRRIFEEAAGIISYKTSREDAERKLSKSSDDLERISDILGELEERLPHLEEESRKAREYLEIRDRYRDLKVNVVLRNIDSAREKETVLEQELRDAERETDQCGKALDALQEAERQEAERKVRSEEEISRINRDLLDASEKISSLRHARELRKERITSLEREEARVQEELSALEEKAKKAELSGEDAEQEIQELEKQTQEASEQTERRKKEYDRLTEDASGRDSIIDRGNEKLFSLHSDAASQKSELRSTESYLTALNRREEELEKNLYDLEERMKALEVSITQLKNGLEGGAFGAEDILAELKEKERQRQECRQKEAAIRQKKEKTRIRIGQLEMRKHTIEEMEQNHEGYSYAVKFILNAGLPGIEGVCAGLFDVEREYALAIETALGGAKQNIICRDDRSARDAVALLKEKRAGRLTFLPAASIRGKSVSPGRIMTSDPGYIGIGTDLIRFDRKYQNVFDYLLGRTAVVDTLDTAIRLSKIRGEGIRFVTLDGELINVSGAITGGKRKTEGISVVGRKSEIRELAASIEEDRKVLSAAERREREFKEKAERTQSDIDRLKKEHYDKELEKAGAAQDLQSREKERDQIGKEIKSTKEEEHRVQENLRNMEASQKDLQEQIRSLEEEIGKVTLNVEQTAEEYAALQKAQEEAGARLTESRITEEKSAGRLEAARSVLARIRQEIGGYEEEAKQKEFRIRNIRKIRSSMTEDPSASDASIREQEKIQEELQKKLKKEEEEKKRQTAKLEAVRAGICEKQVLRERSREYRHSLDVQSAKNSAQLDNLKNKLWDEFELSYAQAQEFRQEDFVMSTSLKESRRLHNRIRELGDVSISSIDEYERVSQRYRFLSEQRQDAVRASEELQSIIREMNEKITRRFRESFDAAGAQFEAVFRQLFGGGHAELRLEDPSDPLESGVEIVAQPPGKKLQNINLLSGGEKTMTAIALMFSVLRIKPTPFCILDEVEAALDDRNIIRFADYLKKYGSTQFALITHQQETMEHADVLFGITMPERGVSKVISLKLGEFDPDEYTN